jgi:hypothetical protein
VVRALGASSTTPALRGPLIDRSGPGRRLAGALLPQPTVQLDGRERLLDDVLGDGPAQVELLPDGRLRVGELAVVDPSGAVAARLRRAGARCVEVRPDRIVRAAR